MSEESSSASEEEKEMISEKTTETTDTKIVDIKQGEITYKCKISIFENNNKDKFLQAKLFLNEELKSEGKIISSEIKKQIEYNFRDINNIFNYIYGLKKYKFQLINNKLSIDITILLENRKIEIDLMAKENDNDNDINNDQKKIINKYYDDFNIELKKPIHNLDYHTHYVYCSTMLKDGRFATGSLDKSIIIYNIKTFKSDITIKEHNSHVYCLIQLSCGLLASCSDDKTIKLYNINGNNYTVMQTLNDHTDTVFHIIELNNRKLVSCSCDETIKFYNIDDNNKYKLDYSIPTNGSNGPVIQTKNNEICYQESDNNLCFYDIIEKKVITKINNIELRSYIFKCMIMITIDLLVVSGYNQLYIININSYELIKPINSPDSSFIICNLLLDENILLTGDNNGRLIQWKIENDNLKKTPKKEKAHNCKINTLLKIGNDFIVSGGNDEIIKIWSWKN